jgi:DNA-binding response OmpR family regulator
MYASKAKKILTVDDDEDIRSSISERLELEGFQTVWAKNGRVALEYMKATPDQDLPDLILLDYMMPIMNGQEFCKEKAKLPRLAHIPVVMMTAGGNLVSVMDKIDSNADGYMSKPMDDMTIVNMVRHFLDHLPETSSQLTESVTTNPEMLNETLGINSEAVQERVEF